MSCCSGPQRGSALPGLPSQVWSCREVNPTVQDTVETSSDEMDNGSEVYKPSTKLLNFVKKQIFIGIKVDRKENGRNRERSKRSRLGSIKIEVDLVSRIDPLQSPNQIKVDRPIHFDLYRSSIFFELHSLAVYHNQQIFEFSLKCYFCHRIIYYSNRPTPECPILMYDIIFKFDSGTG